MLLWIFSKMDTKNNSVIVRKFVSYFRIVHHTYDKYLKKKSIADLGMNYFLKMCYTSFGN